MKQETSPVGSSLRAATLAITLVSIVTFSTVLYSAYAEVQGVMGVLGQNSGNGVISTRTTTQNESATLYVNATLPNRGLYPLRVALSCSPAQSTNVTCQPGVVTIAPGSTGTLRFSLTSPNLSRIGAAVPANFSVELEPFASISVSVDLSSLANRTG